MAENDPGRTLPELCKALPEIILNPEQTPAYAPSSRRFTGIPGLAVSPAGRLWAAWYAGKTPGEDEHNYVVVPASDDSGVIYIVYGRGRKSSQELLLACFTEDDVIKGAPDGKTCDFRIAASKGGESWNKKQ